MNKLFPTLTSTERKEDQQHRGRGEEGSFIAAVIERLVAERTR